LFHHDCAALPNPRLLRRPLLQEFAVNGLLVGIVTGAFGMAYFVYGKRLSRIAPIISGVLL